MADDVAKSPIEHEDLDGLPNDEDESIDAGTGRFPPWLRHSGSVGLWIIIIVSAITIVMLVLVPRIAGAQPFTILTGSMQPDMPAGSIVIVKPVPFDEIRQGDVVTYQLSSGEPMVVTHRVVGLDVVEGEIRLRTQGDANNAPDAQTVRAEQVKGVVWYYVPLVGYMTSFLDDALKEFIVKVLGVVLIGYAAFLIVSTIWHRKTPSKEV